MTGRGRIAAGALVWLLLAPAVLPGQQRGPNEQSCRVCHVDATRGLEQSVHARLLRDPDRREQACASCHGDLGAHARAAGALQVPLPAVPAVGAASCKACHGDAAPEPASARHGLQQAGSGQPPARPELPPSPTAAAEQVAAWSAVAAFGYRFVHHEGSRDAFATDVDLEPGFRVRELGLHGRDLGSPFADELSLTADDLGDPHWRTEARLRRDGSHELRAGYERDRYLYRVSGDHHRVDRDSAYSHGEASLELGGGLHLFGDLARRDEDGYYWFVGRADDVIKSAGHLIGPFEVESALLEHAAVAEAGVIGKPDPTVGAIVKAFVSLKTGFEPSDALKRDLLAHARRKLGPAVAPREIEILAGLPKTRSGKIMRRLLKARELGLPAGDTSMLEAEPGAGPRDVPR
jgi:hypothetical protein